MIEKMQKIFLVCLSTEKYKALASLQKQGTFHVVQTSELLSEEYSELKQKISQLDKLINSLSEFKLEARVPSEEISSEDLFIEARASFSRIKEIDEQLSLLNSAIRQLEPWGAFSQDLLKNLTADGWSVAFCSSLPDSKPELPEDSYSLTVNISGGREYFLVLRQQQLDLLDLPVVNFSLGTDLAALQAEHKALTLEKEQLQDRNQLIAAEYLEQLREYKLLLSDRESFTKAIDGMGAHEEELVYLQGFIPDKKLSSLLALAKREGWAVKYNEASADDPDVPTKLNIPKRFQMAKLILDFIGVLPGYNEVDVSIPLLVFLSIFCGMLVGDAGYGLLLTIVALVLRFKLPQAEVKKRQGVTLLLIMSTCILVFGALTGNWFAIPAEKLPAIFHGIPWFSEDTNSDNVKLLGFFIGAFHLSLARIWAAIISGNRRDSLGNIGWAMFLWANFFTVKMLLISGGSLGFTAKLLYLVGTLLILTCSVNWLDMGDIIYAPFNFINSLVDVLSYIRLYAVGLSSFFIAESFNSMSAMVWQSSVWLIPVALIIILCGHTLNLALATMGVLVHGIRLNTLEFSGHIGLDWGGKAYQPLKITAKDKES